MSPITCDFRVLRNCMYRYNLDYQIERSFILSHYCRLTCLFLKNYLAFRKKMTTKNIMKLRL